MYDSAFYVSRYGFEPFAVVVGHIVLSSVKHPHSERLPDVVEVLLLFELLFLGALHKLPDVVRNLCAFFFGVAHSPQYPESQPHSSKLISACGLCCCISE